MKQLKLLSLVITISFVSAAIAAEPHWGYEGKADPAHWSGLTSDVHTCHEGKLQSPIDITNPIEGNYSHLIWLITHPLRRLLIMVTPFG
ncbi:hypothetical protein [Pantoea vagans]|uniref:hypothetical protein n=1 Tax=Pantoea vagans TaxID=470934 RepID=UPI003017B776